MHRFIIPLVAFTVVGCATQRRPARTSVPVAANAPLVSEATPTRVVETRYEIRGYRDANNPSVRHEAHAVYRMTRVPVRSAGANDISLETVPREKFAPASHAPLSPSAELAAELATQKQITAELRTIRAAIATMEKQAQDQYSTLVNQTADTIRLRQQLAEERRRTQELQARVHDETAGPPSVVASSAATSVGTPETKW